MLFRSLNNHDVLHDEKDPLSALTGSVEAALRLGCAAIGFTIYPGSDGIFDAMESSSSIRDRRSRGDWSYSRTNR